MMTQTLLPAYFLPGPEIGRKRERINQIQQEISVADGEKPELHRFYPYDTETAEIIAVLLNRSFFSSRRLVIMADAHALKAEDMKLFIEYLASPSSESVLIFTTDFAPGSREYPRSLANALPKKAIEVFWEMFEKDKRGWVMRFFREKGLRIEASALTLLLDVTEGTSDALKETCELLCFLKTPDQVVTEDDVDKALEHSRSETVYSLFDRFCRRDLPGVLDAYHWMRYSDSGKTDHILTMLSAPLIRLRNFKHHIGLGLAPEAAAKAVELRGGKRALRAFIDGSQKFSETEIQNTVQSLIELEAWLRTASREIRKVKTELWFCRILGS